MNWFGHYEGEPVFDPDSGILTGFKPANFWIVFAVFFPAVTGIMAGVNMSGELSNPRASIPKGTLLAVILTALIYLALIFVASLMATREELISDYYIFINRSAWKPIVVAGLLGATFSSGTELDGRCAKNTFGAGAKEHPAPQYILRQSGLQWRTAECHLFLHAGGDHFVVVSRPECDRSPDHDVLPDHLCHDQCGGAHRTELIAAQLPADVKGANHRALAGYHRLLFRHVHH
jgi:hypothetical protein